MYPYTSNNMPLNNSALKEKRLVDGCSRNDRRAQEELYRDYCQAMLTLCRTYTKNEEDAVEVLQDGFLKIFQQIHRFRPGTASLYTWMRTIMIHTAIDSLRRQSKQPESVEWREVDEPCLDAAVLQAISAQHILYLLQQLPDTTRAVFNLFVTEGCSHSEIAATLNICEGTSKWLLSEARKSLINSLKIKTTA